MDTTELLTDQDLQDLEDYVSVKKRLYSYLDLNKLIKNIKKIINDSELVSFKNERSEKFIDVKKPIFYLKIDIKKAIDCKDYLRKDDKFESLNSKVKYCSNIIYREVLCNITENIFDEIHKNPELESYILSKNIFKDYKDDEISLKMMMNVLTTTYGMRFDQNDPSNLVMQLLF